ncbi:carbohydrate ABC transporter permease [Halorubrum kocurii]|nr:sugar ABC transporter permease [Halorubrum kocurii]
MFDRDMTIKQKEMLLGYVLILPSVLLVGASLVYPVAYNIYLSFTEIPVDPTQSPEWVGLANYQALVSDPEFWEAVQNTLIFTFFSDVGATALGLGVALLFRNKFRGDGIMRGLVLLPYIAPLIAIAFTWRWLLQPTYGIVPHLLQDVLELYPSGTNIRETLGMVILFDTWRYFPFAFLLILARVRSIPNELYEAAKIDGAGRVARFKDITLPELKFVLAAVFLLRWIWNFNVFSDVWLFVGNNVPILGTFVYVRGFNTIPPNQGYAAAVANLMVIGLFVMVIGYVKYFLDW